MAEDGREELFLGFPKVVWPLIRLWSKRGEGFNCLLICIFSRELFIELFIGNSNESALFFLDQQNAETHGTKVIRNYYLINGLNLILCEWGVSIDIIKTPNNEKIDPELKP